MIESFVDKKTKERRDLKMVIGIILGVVFAILAIVGIFVMVSGFDDGNGVKGFIGLAIAAVMVICFIIIPFSFHTVDTGEIAVVKHLGEAKEVKSSGTHFNLWVTDKYMYYDTKVQNVDIVTSAYSSDAQTMNITMTLQYQIMADNVMDIAKQYGTLEALQTRIQSVATEKTKAALSEHKAMDIIANRAQMSPAVEAIIREAIDEDYYVKVVTVVLTNIDFSDAFELAVEEKMIAEQTKLKAEYENQTKVAQAEANAEAKVKEAEAKVEIAKAEAEAKKIAAEGEAKANELIQNSITDKILDKLWLDKWDGKLPSVVAGEDTSLMIPSVGN